MIPTHVMRALGGSLSDALDKVATHHPELLQPENRLQLWLAMAYGEAANEGLTLSQLLDRAETAWAQHATTVSQVLDAMKRTRSGR